MARPDKLPAPTRPPVERTVPDGPLSAKMEEVLVALLDVRDEWYGLTGNEIGFALGYRQGDTKAHVGGASKYSGVRSMGAAQAIIPCLTALTRRELIRMASRRDDRSGTAYRLTDAGLAEALRIKGRQEEK